MRWIRNWRIEYHKRKAKKYVMLCERFKRYSCPVQSYDYFLKARKHVRKAQRIMEGSKRRG